ncbi:hypothetical protein RJ640_019621 [Escallonia rubra]|uniref:Pentatricopeptide repeat-containing protein n=1 Tax=Escallonia rubra TaxID=112253 RepID=A0AA88U311_9ASTE|nr:hypothetical protein RJ640_019621 [Escallonia rubra]
MLPAIANQSPARSLLCLFQFTKTLGQTHQLHAQITIFGLHRAVLHGSNLANAYIEVGCLQSAAKAFNQITHKNPYSWNTILSGYSKQSRPWDVLRLFKRMRDEGFCTDSFNSVFALKACLGLSLLENGKMVHCLVIKYGLERDPFAVPAVINLYTELGCLEDAHKVFDDMPERNLVVWSAMLKGYLKFSEEYKVFEFFSRMTSSGFELNPFTLETLIRACGNVLACREGKACHGFCMKSNFIDSSMCLLTSLVDMYLKCGLFDIAVKLFEEISDKDLVLWSALVGGCTKNGRALEAIRLFRRMLEESVVPNSVTLASVILACSQIGSLLQGKSVHAFMFRNAIEPDVVNYTSFLDMYAKCGCIVTANSLFNQIPEKNVYCWTSMINAFGMHGLSSEAISLFDQMISENVLPNSVTFVSLLSACSHSGKVEEGWKCFRSMREVYGIAPVQEHYACMVDLLGRAGKIDEALALMSCMPMDPGASAWGALLSSCRAHKNTQLAEKIAKKLLYLEPDKSAVYVLLSNIFADVGKWDTAKQMRLEVCEKGLRKSAGCASIEVDKKLYVFNLKDSLAYRELELEGVWASIHEQMMELGYVTGPGSVLHDVVDDGNNTSLCGHLGNW